jgi:hypothetical protein
MRVVAVVPSVFCAYAWTDTDQVDGSQVGTWDLSLQEKRVPHSQGEQLLMLCRNLAGLEPEAIVYQSMGGFAGLGGTHSDSVADVVLWWALSNSVKAWLRLRGEVKIHATGYEHALDREVVAAARDRFGFEGTDPRQAHALWTLDLYLRDPKSKSAGRGPSPPGAPLL